MANLYIVTSNKDDQTVNKFRGPWVHGYLICDPYRYFWPTLGVLLQAIGAKSIDLEWVQVHPTGLVKPDDADAKIKFLAAEVSVRHRTDTSQFELSKSKHTYINHIYICIYIYMCWCIGCT